MSERLEDRFELLRKLGEGNMGVVYEAKNLRPKNHEPRFVALKVMNAALAINPEAVTRFEHEYTGLIHQNIVQVYEFVKLSGNLCLVMELIPGETLDRLIEDRKTLSVNQKVRLIADVCRALDYAHKQGHIHRDLKPSNVMMQPDGSPKIIDFGIAKNTNRKSGTVAGSFIGTYAYMSPEQADGIPVTFQSDLFSAAVVLYELLTGICPFDGEDIFVTRRKILRDPTPSIPDHILDIPRRLHGVLEKALAKDPETRYQSGIEMAEALEQSIAPVESPQPSASQPSPRPIDDARLQGAASREAQEPKPAPSLGPQRQVGPRAEPRVPSGQGSDSVPAFELIPEQDPKRYMSVLVVVSLITALLGIGLLVHQIQMRIEQSNSMGPSNSVVQGSAQRSLYWQAQSARDRQDYSSAVSLYSKACSDGTAIACQELADMYGTGTGVQRDANLWASYYGKTCDLGYPSYCLDIGKRLEDGDGVPQDYHMAAAFFKKACDDAVEESCSSLKDLARRALNQ